MRKRRVFAIAGAFGLASVALPSGPARAATLTVNPFKDNTLFESPTGEYSNGAGGSLYLGRTGTNGGNATRRPILAFDVSAIPAGAEITAVTLTLKQTTVAPGAPATPVEVYRLTADWGEGISNSFDPGGFGALSAANDATWVHRYFNATAWNAPGGDFAASPSATQTLGNNGQYAWTGAGLVADVHAWINNPAANFGWLMIGDEGTSGRAQKFDSREAAGLTPKPPTLTVTYTVPEPGTAALLATTALAILSRRRARTTE